MEVDGIRGHRRGKREESSSTSFSLGVKNEQADAGRDGQSCLARLSSQAQTGISFSLFS